MERNQDDIKIEGPDRLDQAERLARVGLSLIAGLGPVSAKRLIEAFGSAGQALAAPAGALRARTGLRPETAARLAKAPELAQRELDRLEKLGGWVVVLGEEAYPEYLRHIHAPPVCLFGLGELGPPDQKAVAVVGSRQATAYGLKVTAQLAAELADLRITVVSGLAHGIDAAAHEGALSAGGRTLAVQGCGLDVDYPTENKKLKERIIGQGAVLSEYPLGIRPEGWRFPVRNRIIAGLAQGVIVAEAAPKSGSLITARLALDFGRTVMAVPGPITDRRSEGPHDLIRQGAVLVTSGFQAAAEVFPGLLPPAQGELFPAGEKPKPDLDAATAGVYELLDYEPRHVDEIIRRLKKGPAEVLGRLLDLELRGLARQLPGQYYVRG